MDLNLTCEVDIDRSASQVWAVLGDVRRLSSWERALLRYEHVSGPEADVGATYEMVRQMDMPYFRSKLVVTQIDPGAAIHYDVEAEGEHGYVLRLVHRVEPTGADTSRMTEDFHMEVGEMSQTDAASLQADVEKDLRRCLDWLKTYVEVTPALVEV